MATIADDLPTLYIYIYMYSPSQSRSYRHNTACFPCLADKLEHPSRPPCANSKPAQCGRAILLPPTNLDSGREHHGPTPKTPPYLFLPPPPVPGTRQTELYVY